MLSKWVIICVIEETFFQNLSQTLGASPVPFGNIVEGRDQAEGVVAVIAAVAQQEAILVAATATH